MSHKLNDITLHYSPNDEYIKSFTKTQNLVSDLYVRFLNNYKPKGTSRISVTLSDRDYVLGYSGSILSAYARFNNEDYWHKDIEKQKRMILDAVHNIAILCADKYGWNKEIFEQAYQRVIEADFIYSIEGRHKLSKDKKYAACILLEKNEDYATVSVNFYNRSNGLISTSELLRVIPHEMFYGRIIKNSKWFDNLTFGLYSKGEELAIRASVEKEGCEVIITPKKHSPESIEAYLLRITYRDSKSEVAKPE